MRTVRFEGQGVARIVEAPEPEPGPGEVVVRTAMSAICGSEMHAYRGPGIEAGNAGHEGAGVVAAVGAGVRNLREGQRVGVSAIAGCGTCRNCRRGMLTWCHTPRFYGSMHAEYFVASAGACHPLPDDVPWDAAVLLSGDGLGVPYHTSTRLRSRRISTVAIFGAGPIGLGSVMLQTHFGRAVTAIDPSGYRREYAERLGAVHTIDPTGVAASEALRERSGGHGVDVAIEAAGRPESARECFASVRHGGTVVFNGEQPALSLSPSDDFIRRDIAAFGSWFYHFREFGAMLELYRTGLPLRDLVSHRYALEDAPAAFAEFAGQRAAKVMLEYAG